MFDIGWSELLILGIVTLIFVGPKDLPVFLRTLGRYAGAIKRQVGDFRAQFEVVMRESELDQMRKEVEAVQTSVNAEITGVKEATGEQAAAPAKAVELESPRSSKSSQADHGNEPAPGARRTATPPMPAPPAGRQ